MKAAPDFPYLLHAFFHEWLLDQQNASHHTVSSYRDAWRLFLRFVAQRHRCRVVALRIEQLTAAEVLAFLKHCEQERNVSIGTRNCRLAALRSFYSFLGEREPQTAAQCAEVLRIPSKRRSAHVPCFLEPEELAAILAQPDRTTPEGQRDHALLVLLYNTGARIQEALDLCPQSLRLERPAQVRLVGKGRKERICPLWPETAELLAALLQRKPRASDQSIFCNRYGLPLGASGVRFRLHRYVQGAAKRVSSLAKKHVSPHCFRHTAAVHLVAAGVDVTVIRNWLGHASLNTTNLYAQTDLQTKRNALERIGAILPFAKRLRRKHDDSLLAWLESL